jgi:hypothetical protein
VFFLQDSKLLYNTRISLEAIQNSRTSKEIIPTACKNSSRHIFYTILPERTERQQSNRQRIGKTENQFWVKPCNWYSLVRQMFVDDDNGNDDDDDDDDDDNDDD